LVCHQKPNDGTSTSPFIRKQGIKRKRRCVLFNKLLSRPNHGAPNYLEIKVSYPWAKNRSRKSFSTNVLAFG
jgi:hypothetical protein